MRPLLYLSLFLCLLTSCLPRHEVLRNPQTTRKPAPQRTVPGASASKATASRTSISGHEYIRAYKDIAISEMNTYGIPASIKLAQALLESGNGNSALARESNNHFGIKCGFSWQGDKTYKDDDRRNDCFRVYDRAEESFRDHSQFLLRDRYARLFELDKDDYRGWARGLKAAGYATNPRYADLLIDLIERYELYQYDRPESRSEKLQREAVAMAEIIENMPEERQQAQAKPPVAMVIHEVKAGETLYSISRKYGLSTQEILSINGLREEAITAGQLLLVSK